MPTIATGRCSVGGWRSAAKTRMPMMVPTATTTAAISSARGGPSWVSESTRQTLGPHSVGDRAGQRAGDAGDMLNAGHDGGAQLVEGVRPDAHDHVVRAGDVLR